MKKITLVLALIIHFGIILNIPIEFLIYYIKQENSIINDILFLILFGLWYYFISPISRLIQTHLTNKILNIKDNE